MLFATVEQRQALYEEGAPMPFLDEHSGATYMLLSVEFLFDARRKGFTVHIPGIAAYGEGDTKEHAVVALQEALRGYLEAFDDD